MKKGALVYMATLPDEPNALPQAQEGFEMVYNLLDKSILQVPMTCGIIGDDHTGPWNWDGIWPYWNRVSFRANHDWKTLHDFMAWTDEHANTKVSFHLNITDVNVGLREYPETREFLQKLIETKSIYRRDPDADGQRVHQEPYVPKDLLAEMQGPDWDGKPRTTVGIVALVNYGNFWDSGLAKSMVDEFYSHLPYAPPVIYLDVLNAAGGNFPTGFPDGPLGGSEATQIKGMQDFADYLHSKGTDVGTEGARPFLGINDQGVQRAGYVWLHGPFSNDDYSVISGNPDANLFYQHVYGTTGSFNMSPVAFTADQIAKDRAHYAALLAGKPGTKPVPGFEKYHISCIPGDHHDEFDIPGCGDQFRGDWVDLVNNFYLSDIQELYHIGNGAVRTRLEGNTTIHVKDYTLTAPGGDITVSFPEFFVGWQREGAVKMGEIMLSDPIDTKVTVPKAGDYPMKFRYTGQKADASTTMNIYVNGVFYKTVGDFITDGENFQTMNLGSVHLNEGENSIAVDTGKARATWTDGTVSEWTTPFLKKGFKVTNGDLTLAEEYDRMWPDTWSGQQKIYFFSWDGTNRAWKLPMEWREKKSVTLYPLTPDGRGKGEKLTIADGSISPKLLPQVPYILVP